MDSKKLTYAEVLKNQSGFLNPNMHPTPLIPKAPKVRLSEEALSKLRRVIHDKSNSRPAVKKQKPESVASKQAVECSKPLVLATASDWVMSGSVMRSAIYDNKQAVKIEGGSEVRLLTGSEIANISREGMKENPIDVCDESDDEKLGCGESMSGADKYSVDGQNDIECMSDFDPDVVFNEGMEVLKPMNEPTKSDNHEKVYSELNKQLRVDATDSLIRAKRRMEHAFMDDYALKMKPFRRLDRPEYEGEYTFTVRIGVDDGNVVEVKDTITTCIIKKTEDEVIESEEDYTPETDVDTKRRRMNREALAFDPVTQLTRYNTKKYPEKIPVIEINEKATETQEYHWLAKYESVPSNTQFNRFLNKFKNGSFAPKVASFDGVRYRFLRVGTSSKLSAVKQYNQFVIGNNFSVYRLGMNGSPNVNMGMNAAIREKSFPPPINKKFTIASLFWANELLKTQKAW